MKAVLLSALAVVSVGLVARAQFTPGSGGTYNQPVMPSAPVVPGGPSQPQAPTPPHYSWEVPMTPGQQQPQQQAQPGYQPNLQPVSPDVVRIAPPAPVYVPQISDAQMADLTAAIALYPDPILSEMLPSTTYVEELTFADRWLEQHPGADEYTISGLPLQPSVKTMMHYGSVLRMMTDHLDWTQALGAAFLYQRQDLMESVQRWRRTAVSYGTLSSSPQQDVLQQGEYIMIVPPPRQQVVYVPVYDPAIVYVRPIRPVRDVITFSAGGFSLSFIDNDLDWRGHEVRVPRHHDDGGPRGGDGRSGGGTSGGGTSGGGTTGGGSRGGGSGGDPGGSRGGRGGSQVVDVKTNFIREDTKPAVIYPTKVVTPQPGHKVLDLPAGRGNATQPVNGRGVIITTQPSNGRGNGGRPGGLDGNPNTPF